MFIHIIQNLFLLLIFFVIYITFFVIFCFNLQFYVSNFLFFYNNHFKYCKINKYLLKKFKGCYMLKILFSTGIRILGLIWMFIRHPNLIYKANKKGKNLNKNKIDKQKLTYALPEYKEGMYNSISEEKYIRPTRLCESNSPEIIAMANKLGISIFSQKDYAKNVFNFVKNNIKTKSVPVLGAVETIKRSCGSCFDSSGLFITLCRCRGIKARYKIYLHQTPPEGIKELDKVIDKNLLDSVAIMAAFYTVSEVFIDGRWMECEVDSPPELDAYWNVPIAHFGENVSTVKGWIPNEVVYWEKIPLYILIPTNIIMKLLSGIFEGSIAEEIERQSQIGKEKLQKIGIKEYDKKVRRQYGFLPPLD